MTAAYVRSYYHVPAKRGARIVFDGKQGVITGFRSQYLLFREDGERHSAPIHPTWHVQYLPGPLAWNPPYWPYRCAACSRFVTNPVATHNTERITAERGDCSRCGPQVPLQPLCWEDWFSEDYDPADAILGATS